MYAHMHACMSHLRTVENMAETTNRQTCDDGEHFLVAFELLGLQERRTYVCVFVCACHVYIRKYMGSPA